MEGGGGDAPPNEESLYEPELRKLSEIFRSGWTFIPQSSDGTEEEECRSDPAKKQDNTRKRAGISATKVHNNQDHTNRRAGRIARPPCRVELRPFLGYMSHKQNPIDWLDLINIISSSCDNDKDLGSIQLEVIIGFMPEKQNVPTSMANLDIMISFAEQSTHIPENPQNDQSSSRHGRLVGAHTKNKNYNVNYNDNDDDGRGAGVHIENDNDERGAGTHTENDNDNDGRGAGVHIENDNDNDERGAGTHNDNENDGRGAPFHTENDNDNDGRGAGANTEKNNDGRNDHDNDGRGAGGHTDNDDDETNKAECSRNEQRTTGDVQRMFGSVENLASALNLNQENEQSKQLSCFIEKHHHDAGNKDEDGGVFQLVLLNLPSGMQVYGFKNSDVEEVPSWNMMSVNLIVNGLSVASKIMSKSGWVVCIHTWEQSRQVEDAAVAAHLVLLTTLTLVSNLPIYRHRQPKERMHTLFISIFHRAGNEQRPELRPAHADADKDEDAAIHQLLSRDVIIEKIDKREWAYNNRNGEPCRGGAQRSSILWQSLILALSKRGDLVVDLIASTSTCEFINLASQLGRHALAVEENRL